MKRFCFAAIGLLLILSLSGCPRGGESGLEGTILFGDRPLAGAQVEVYLKAEKDRATLPFSVASTDDAGRYRLSLPTGRYFVIAKKREEGGGHPQMLMAECPANPLEVENQMRQVPAFSLREMGRDGALVADPGTVLRGRVTAAGLPLARAYVYLYTESAAGLMGPSYGEAVQTEADGRFQIKVPAGRYYLAARKRADGSRLGEPSPGDLNGSFAGNPVSVAHGQELDLGDFPLTPVDAEQFRQRHAAGKFAATATALSGQAVDQDGHPLKGIYVFAYLDSRMIGKPTYISDPTGSDGRFNLYLGSGGSYFVGARSTFGGPLEPGEWVGTFDGRPDHGVDVVADREQDLGALVLREVW
ncbi:hypothetical protein JCM30471_16390 [Desulfuromonas carbonis]|uniref:MSCRAMM family protein n=1 Tax=Desulfuromonas sp. DDH964 TaxID=1823759 RepID=UPI00078D7944|nr:carboxypeptidase regulatory-like domain-containing protein [Desulfuromonas sp. DDH964]AMV73236.1 hypothetical protein DBW_2927 [Desulfuromonas sp. DDH964]